MNKSSVITPKNLSKSQITAKIKKKSGLKSKVSNFKHKLTLSQLINTEHKSYLISIILSLFSASFVVSTVIWLAIALILDPNAIVGLNRYLPSWLQIPLAIQNPPQTLAEIAITAQQEQLRVGEPIKLNSEVDSEVIIPFWRKQINCQQNCEGIVELRVYLPTVLPRNKELYYRLVDQVVIPPITEEFVVNPVLKIKPDIETNSAYLSLNKINFDRPSPYPGIWLNITGSFVKNQINLTYGQLLYYHPTLKGLNLVLPWTSTKNNLPQWQQVTGDQQPELVIDQSINLEPQLQIYKLQKNDWENNQIEFAEIKLEEAIIKTPNYAHSLQLAQQGLWSIALAKLQQVKLKISSQTWNAQAQTQLDMISIHAQISQEQCQKSWLEISQKIRACLIDGNVQESLNLLQAYLLANQQVKPLVNLLKTEDERIQQRLEVILANNPKSETTKILMMVILAMQSSREEALNKLEKLPQTTPETWLITAAILDRIELALAPPKLPKLVKIIGTASKVSKINFREWIPLLSNQNLANQLDANWYKIEVNAFYDGERWQKMPLANFNISNLESVPDLGQQLGLVFDTPIHLSQDSDNREITAKVKAVKISKNKLILLTNTGANLEKPNPWLAYTDETLNKVETGILSIADIYQLQPKWGQKILNILGNHLRGTNKIKPDYVPSIHELLGAMGYWLVQTIDLTGNQQPELILTLSKSAEGNLSQPLNNQKLPGLKTTNKYTLIIGDNGQIIYSDLQNNNPQSLQSITDLQDGKTPVLIIKKLKGNYEIKRWSNSDQKFK